MTSLRLVNRSIHCRMARRGYKLQQVRLLSSFRIVLLAAALIGSAGLSGSEIRQHRWDDASRVVAFADVHGAYGALVDLLEKTGVMDASLGWVGGSTHLVSLGDLLDRGGESRKVLELLMRLDQEAQPDGGRVHVTLGNHEIMNLTGDLRYVSAAEYDAFADAEDVVARRSAFARFTSRTQSNFDETAQPFAERPDYESLFTEKFPLGFFAHRSAFGFNGRYGQWLLRQSQVLVISDTVFVHGGLSPEVAGLGLEEINQRYDGELFELMRLRQDLLDRSCIFTEQDLSEAVLEAAESDCEPTVVRRFSQLVQGVVFSEHSPTWFRGGALCHALLEEPNLSRILADLGTRRIVVGHSPTADHRVQQRFAGRLIRMDTGMLRSHYRGQPSALVIEGDTLNVVYLDDATPQPDIDYRRSRVNREETFFRNGIIDNAGSSRNRKSDPKNSNVEAHAGVAVRVKWQGEEIAARFVPLKAKDVNHELAAYVLDRLLNLDLVPTTVAREYSGKRGVLIGLSSTIVTEAERLERKLVRPNWCGDGNVYQLMYAYDGLIKNNARSAGNMAYDIRDWRLVITEHQRSFGRGSKLPAYLQQTEQVLPKGFADELKGLTEEKLRSTLGDLLNKSEISGLLKRRELLLDNWKIAG